jgi:hypothetical protein
MINNMYWQWYISCEHFISSFKDLCKLSFVPLLPFSSNIHNGVGHVQNAFAKPTLNKKIPVHQQQKLNKAATQKHLIHLVATCVSATHPSASKL